MRTEAPTSRPRSPWLARALLLATVAVTALGLWQATARGLPAPSGRGEDSALYAAIVQDLRAGGSYYAVAPHHMRMRGYALASPFNYRLPTLAVLMASVPSDGYARGILLVLGCATMVLWYQALRRYVGVLATFAALLALSGLLAWAGIGQAFRVHETWAGAAIAMSLALFALGHGISGMLVALAALSLRELALPYLLVCLVFAARTGKRGELYVGLGGLAAFLAAYCVHIFQLPVAELSASLPWIEMGGLAFLLKTLRMNLWLLAAPDWLTALALPLAMLGLSAFPGPLGQRTRATVYVFAAVFLVVGLPYNHLWGLLYAGPALIGLAFAHTALRGLWRSAFPGHATQPGS